MPAAVALVGKEQKSLGVAHVGEVLEAGERRPDQDLFALVLGQLGLAPVVGDVFLELLVLEECQNLGLVRALVPGDLGGRHAAGESPRQPHGAGRGHRGGGTRGVDGRHLRVL